MSRVFNDVAFFMTAAGQTIMEENPKQAELYGKLIHEEYVEFVEAINDKDDVETLDACFDMMWVIVGYMHSRGWECTPAWEEGARSNLVKIDALTGKCIKREDGKILKPEGWEPPNFKKFMKN